MPTNSDRSQPNLVSVVIPVYNAVDVIDIQLDALAGQVYTGRFEVIVADNGSTDGLREHIAGHQHSERLQLRWLDASQRRGPGAARNVGVKAARGDFIAFCDADDQVYPDWLSALTDAATRCAAVGGPTESHTLNTPEVQKWRDVNPPETPFTVGRFICPSGCNAAIWRDVFEQIGGYDETYEGAGEDTELMIRVQLAGGTVEHVPGAMVAYRLRDTHAGCYDQARRYGVSMVRMYSVYRHDGVPKNPWYRTLDVFLFLILRNPLLPQAITRAPRGRWLHVAGWLAGWTRGSIRYRCLYL